MLAIKKPILRDIVRLVGVQGLTKKQKKQEKKNMKKIALILPMLAVIVGQAHAEATAYFELPADFSDNVQATIVGIAGGILVILGLMFAWRKTVKSVNRS